MCNQSNARVEEFKVEFVPQETDQLVNFDHLLKEFGHFFSTLNAESVEMTSLLTNNRYSFNGRNFKLCSAENDKAEASTLDAIDFTLTIGMSSSQVKQLIYNIFDKTLLKYCFIWTFGPFYDYFTQDISKETSPMKVISFSIGNIVNGNRFVTHLNEFQSKEDSRLFLMNKLTVKQADKQFSLSFTLNYCVRGSQSIIKSRKFTFLYNNNSFQQVIISLRERKYLELYIDLDCPPEVYTWSTSSNCWSRWQQSDPISLKVVGKCKTLKLKCELDGENVIKSMVSSVKKLYDDCSSAAFYICRISEYCIDESQQIDLSGLPFSVHYAIECINSLSFLFNDDLHLNRKEKLFIGLLKNYIINYGEARVVDALYELFKEYVTFTIHNAYDAFERLFEATSQENDENDENNNKNNSSVAELSREEDNFIRQIILTPLQTIILPPLKTLPTLIIGDANYDKMIKVSVRNECSLRYSLEHGLTMGKYQEPKLSKSFNESACIDYFINEIIDKRLMVNRGGLKIANRTYKYHRSSIAQLFTNGILLHSAI